MSINNKFLRLQQQNIRNHVKKSDLNTFFSLLDTPDLLLPFDDFQPNQRNRLYPTSVTLSMYLMQTLSADCSCQNIVNIAAINRMNAGLPSGSILTGGYCRARHRLPIKIVSSLVHKTAHLTENLIPKRWRWQGKRVHLIDGTTLTMPDTKENQAIYPQQAAQKPGLGFPVCRVVGVICLASGTILNAAIGAYKGKGASEQALLRQLLATFNAGDLVVGDAMYGSYFLLCALLDKGVDMVFEQMGGRKNSVDFNKGESLGINDHLISFTKPKDRPHWMTEAEYKKQPDSLLIREVAVDGKILITNKLSPIDTPKAALKALYKKRWNIEVDLRNIKSTLGMAILRCKTPAMNQKEIWVYFLAYNLIRLLMVQAALHIDLLPRQLSFKHSLQLGLAFVNHYEPNQNKITLLDLIGQRIVGNRPGRIEPRAIKRRPKSYPLLMKARPLAQQEVRQNGHPKKLK